MMLGNALKCAAETCPCRVQEFFTLHADPEISKPVGAGSWDTLLHSAAPPYGATCLDFHKVEQPACIMNTVLARSADICTCGY